MLPVKLLEQIGSGSQGEVFRAYHQKLQKDVAVKRMKSPNIAAKELYVWNNIKNKCPNTPKFVEYIVHEDNHYFIMEHIHGISGKLLLDLTNKGIFLSEAEVASIIYHVTESLAFLHSQEFIYGDIKPDNIIFMPPKRACVIDFGCTREGPELSIPVGTPPFFAPEKFDWSYGYASDVWALGVVMYLYLCGVHPFIHHYRKQRDRYIIEHEIRTSPLAFCHPRWDNISKDAQDLLVHMLQRDVDKRITAEEMLSHPWFHKK